MNQTPTHKKFRVCYIVEFSGTARFRDGSGMSYLEHSIEEVLGSMVNSMIGVLVSAEEELEINIGKVDCTDLDDKKIAKLISAAKLQSSTLFFKRGVK